MTKVVRSWLHSIKEELIVFHLRYLFSESILDLTSTLNVKDLYLTFPW
jgi:hypothetical protein